MKEGWEVKKLGEVTTISYGYTEKSSLEVIGPKFLRITDIQNGAVNWGKVPYCKISDSDFLKYKLSEGDIVFARTGATTGKSFLLKNPPYSVYASYLIKVSLKNKTLTPYFLYYFFQTKYYWDTISAGISGSAQAGFNASKLSQISFSYPSSLSEQQRIVSILDAAFLKIEKLKSNAELNLNNAKALFQSALQYELSPKEGWEVKKLGEVCEVTSSKRIYKNEYVNKGIPFYRTKELKELSHNKNITLELFISDKRYNEIKSSFGVPQIGDILVSAVGTIGEILVVKDDQKFYFKDGNIIWLKKFTIEKDSTFFRYCLNAQIEMIKKITIGSTYNALTIEKFKEMNLSFPSSLSEQQSIVEKLDSLSSRCQAMEANYKQTLKACDELKQSLLTKAFNGEL